MRRLFLSSVLLVLILCSAISNTKTATARFDSAAELVGLWEAKLRFGPDVRGGLIVRQTGGNFEAEIAGRIVPIKADGGSISFALPGEKGNFSGKFDARRTKIAGHWMQQRTMESGFRYVSPVTLAKNGAGEWRGNIAPIDDTQTFYLMIKTRDDGSVGAFFRNPERNLGWFQFRADRIERDGAAIKIFAGNKRRDTGQLLAEGKYDKGAATISIPFPSRGGTFDFRKVADGEPSNFYPRGRATETYRYMQPPIFDDGWQTGTLEEAGLSRAAIEKFIQAVIDTPIDSANAQEDHAILIARRGKLVLEEYFHGENRDKPHDTRSASKSVASDLMGAMMQSGVDVNAGTYVYKLMNGGEFPTGLEPRKRAMTVGHLLTMSSGLDCDEGDDKSAGFEDKMWEQTDEPDYYKWTMALAMVREPGEKGVYCSASPNLVGGVLKKASGKPIAESFQNLLAEPLSIKRYYLPTSPTGDVAFTGGHRFLPRDFIKLPQLHLGGGTWNGRRIYSQEWSRRATTPSVGINSELNYAYLWWIKEYPYNGKTIRAYFASGNGGQIAMAIPELDLALAFYAGNYNDVGGRTATDIYVPKYILPAVEK